MPKLPPHAAQADPVSANVAPSSPIARSRPYLDINDAPPRLERFRAWLTAEERERASRYRFEADRRRFAWTRGVLRALLASYVGCTPARIHFAVGPKGKLYLDPPHDGLRFNVSHSHEWALIALARNREVGVDVEHHRPLQHDLFEIATRFFAPVEVQTLLALDPDDRQAAFFRIWSRKEAYIKATGQGVSAGLDTFDVSIGTEPAVTLHVYDRPEEETRWMMRSLDVGSDYGAAIAVEGHDAELKLWEW
jgi:4'-phosphopantetheinyl transferase